MAHSLAAELLHWPREDGPLWRVAEGLREQARASAATLLGVAYLSEAMTSELELASSICDRWLDVRSGGLPRRQAAIVWVIEQSAGELAALREVNAFDEMDHLLRTRTLELTERIPPELLDAPARSLSEALGARLTTGRGARNAVGAHGLAYRWCDAFGVEFPMYPSSRRATGPSRRARAG